MGSKGQYMGVGESVMILLILASVAAGMTFSGSSSPASVNSGSQSQLFNISVNNTGPDGLISLNISFPTGISYISGSANTSAANTVLGGASLDSIRWDNQTGAGFVDDTTLQYFWFNATVPTSAHGDLDFNITALNTTLFSNSTLAPFRVLVNISSNGSGAFSGQTDANAATYQVFYFNASGGLSSTIPNTTFVYVTITSSSDIDAFLFDNQGNFRAKAISKSTGTDTLSYGYLSGSDDIWELRVFGNSTSAISFTGNVFLTTINATNSTGYIVTQSNPLAFGRMNQSVNKTLPITISNAGGLQIASLTESDSMYLFYNFTGSAAANFSAFIPDSSIITGVHAKVVWTGSANYNLTAFDPSGSQADYSYGKHVYANASGAEEEEYVDPLNAGSTSGFWRFAVANNTPSIGSYYLSIYAYVSASSWISTNASSYAPFSLSTSGQVNSSYPIAITLSVPQGAMNGTYLGNVKYADTNGAGVSVPIRAEVMSPVLYVNGTTSSASVRVDEDYGFNATRNIIVNVTNLGDVSMPLAWTDSGYLVGSGSGGLNATLNYSAPATVAPHSSSLFNVSVGFNSSMPAAVYNGWILANTTNTNANLSAAPYPTFTLNIRLNLTNVVIVNLTVRSQNNTLVVNGSSQGNLTFLMNATLINGTNQILDIALPSNFSVWLQSYNVTGSAGSIPASGYLTTYNGSSAFGSGGNYFVNGSLDSAMPGGKYQAFAILNYSTSAGTYTGLAATSAADAIIVDSPGLYMSTNISSCSFGSACNASFSLPGGTTVRYYVQIQNFGPRSASSSAAPALAEACSGFYEAGPYFVGCPGSSFAASAYSSSCYEYWDITTYSDASYAACTATITGGQPTQYFDGLSLTISIINTTTTTSISSTGGGPLPTQTTTTVHQPAPILSFTRAPSLVPVMQDASNTSVVTVTNVGDKAANVTFSVLDLDSSWFRINSSTASLSTGQSASFMVTFVVGDVAVKDYPGRFGISGGGASSTSGFNLRVLPAPQKIVEINDTLPLFIENFTRVYQEINQTINQGGINASAAQADILGAQVKIQLAQGYIASGDYFSAYQQYDGIRSLIASAETELAAAKQAQPSSDLSQAMGGWMLYAMVGGGLVIIAALGFFFWPKIGPKLSAGKSDFSPRKDAGEIVEQTKEKVKDRFTLDVHPRRSYESSALLDEKPMPRYDGRNIRPVGRFTIESDKGLGGELADKINGLKRKISRE